jgi:Family of unknown function (DUF5329)
MVALTRIRNIVASLLLSEELPRVTRRSLLLLVLGLVFVAADVAAALTATARAEIDRLMSALETSGCEFNRNGSWYSAAEAKSHLLQKLQYLERKGHVNSVEQFIERAASSSSVSGQAYLVRCGNDAPVQSRTWLMLQLDTIRSVGNARSAP